MTPTSSSVVVAGRGRLGTALRRWLVRAHIPGCIVPGRDLAQCRVQWQRGNPGVLILAIPDDALATVARTLAGWGDWRRWRVLHTSGARPAAVLAPLRGAGAAVASMHPMMTFPSQSSRRAVVPSKGIVFSLEGDRAAVGAAATLVRAWQGVVLRLSDDQKSAYHLAATLVGPSAVVQMAAAEMVLRHAGLQPAQLRRARAGLIRLLQATASNLASRPSAQAFTGPWARGDRGSIRVHKRLAAEAGVVEVYTALEALSRTALPNPRF